MTLCWAVGADGRKVRQWWVIRSMNRSIAPTKGRSAKALFCQGAKFVQACTVHVKRAAPVGARIASELTIQPLSAPRLHSAGRTQFCAWQRGDSCGPGSCALAIKNGGVGKTTRLSISCGPGQAPANARVRRLDPQCNDHTVPCQTAHANQPLGSPATLRD